MKNNELMKLSDNIITVLSQMNTQTDVFNFLRDLLSEKEIIEFSRRFDVALLLDQKVPYTQIEEKTNMSSTTIARISKYLKGDNAGYQKAISVLKSITDKHHTDHHS
ncbi:MAG: YerC/YecD family TrpR-related protein [Candidatus Gracilibacteria bacterium]|nr:YerC/YecD family TrpR-related protein [Candidatus Gracilibacteria bacterium]